MTDIELTSVVQEHGIAPLESDIPTGMTIADYRSARVLATSRWERARAVVGRLRRRYRRPSFGVGDSPE